MSVRSWTLAHWRRRRLHPGGRQAVWVRWHRRASHVGHRGREVVGSSMATRPSMHAMEVPVLSWTRAHPRRSVLLLTNSYIRQYSTPTEVWKSCWCQLTGGGWLLLGPEARGAPPWVLECPPPEVGTGASPSSAMRDRYSLSIRALSWADWGGSPPVALWAANELDKATQTLSEHDIYQGINKLLWEDQVVITWCTCSQRRCGLLHHTWYRGWCWWCCEAQCSAKDEGSYRDGHILSLKFFSDALKLKSYTGHSHQFPCFFSHAHTFITNNLPILDCACSTIV